jgi:TPR repeat protein
MLIPLRRSNSLAKPSVVLCILSLCRCFCASPQQEQSKAIPSIAEVRTRAESGDALAQHYLFDFLSQRDSRTAGYDIALDWLRRLAAGNQPDALYHLGFLYEHGHGLRRDYAKAAESYQTAGLLGNDSAQNNLASLYQHGQGVPRSVGKAMELYLASARHGNPIAQCNLASLYFIGSDVPRDLSEAARWFRAAAEQHYPAAQHNLAVLYFKGLGVPADYAEALAWERLAADQRYPEAEAGLAYVYETGKGVPLDYAAAFAWYSRASAHGNRAASERLKSLSRSMTHRQLDEASALLSKLLLN